MKITVDESMFIQRFRDFGRMDQFSIAGLRALFEHIEEMEQGSGEEMELDVIAICCDFSEYETALDAAKEYGFAPNEEADEEGQEDAALEYLRDRTTVLEAGSGYVIAGF